MIVLHAGGMKIRAPAGLGAAGRRLWRSVTPEYDLFPAELALLEQACRTVDTIALMDAELAVTGVMTEGAMGQPRPNGLLSQLVEHRKVLNQLLVSLALPMPGEEYGAIRSPQQHAAAQARWRAEYGRSG